MLNKFDFRVVERAIEENSKVTENDAMLLYVRTHGAKAEHSLKKLARKFGFDKGIKPDKEK